MKPTEIEQSVFGQRYDLVIPLGTACLCANSLKDAGLRYRSLPFDWVSGGTILSRSMMMVEGFKNWLELSEMEYVGEMNGEYKLKAIYRNRLTDINFVHDFLAEAKDFARDFKRVQDKYARRIARLYELCKRSQRILFVWIDYPVTEQAIQDSELTQACAFLRKMNPQAEVSLLYLHNEQGVELNSRSSELLEPGILKMAFCYKAIDSDLKDAVQRKLLKEVFRKIKLSIRNLTFSDLLRKFRIFYIKKNEKGEASVRLFRIPIYKYSLK